MGRYQHHTFPVCVPSACLGRYSPPPPEQSPSPNSAVTLPLDPHSPSSSVSLCTPARARRVLRPCTCQGTGDKRCPLRPLLWPEASVPLPTMGSAFPPMYPAGIRVRPQPLHQDPVNLGQCHPGQRSASCHHMHGPSLPAHVPRGSSWGGRGAGPGETLKIPIKA